MSGPVNVPAGRAEKANHWPSPLYAASSPTSVTPLRIASVAAADGAGVPEAGGLTAFDGGATDGLVPSDGVTEPAACVGRGVGVAPAELELGPALDPVAGLLLELGAGVVVGGLEAGAGGTDITNTVVPSLPRAGPIATAWLLFDGESTTELGTVGRLSRLRDIPAWTAQSGSSPVGQTWLTLAVIRDRPPEVLVTTQVTSDEGTAIGVVTGPAEAMGPGLPLEAEVLH